MELDIKQPETKNRTIFVRVPEKMDNQINILSRKHRVDKSIVVRSLIEMGLKEIKI